MRSALLLAATAAVAILAAESAPAKESLGTMPELAGATRLNTPPLTTADLEDRAILLEVFRTW